MNDPLKIVLDQIEAHNRHDLRAQKDFFADSCSWISDNGTYILKDMEQFIPQYGKVIEQSPNIHIEVKNYMVVGEVVVLEEYISGTMLKDGSEQPPYSCIVTYRVKNNKITNMRVYSRAN
ncbi:nuclear transport factor 2 family protein [Bacillus sp. CGMCC 1.16607]|uniref:nuclear transport factor 2 family protein n=1 Tax=Bacillus sp. CGMCC 1.16607 TaxID=3351842 RepID=UPI0036297D56